MTISLGRALPSASMRRGSFGRAVHTIERSCFRWGLPECASPRDSVSSYLTISPLRGLQRSPRGMFLWHFPSSCPDRTLSCTLPCEARTFLTDLHPRDRPAHFASTVYHCRVRHRLPSTRIAACAYPKVRLSITATSARESPANPPSAAPAG